MFVTQGLDTIITRLDADQDFDAARCSLDSLLEQAIAWAPQPGADFAELIRWRRTVQLMQRLPPNPAGRKRVWKVLRECENFTTHLVLAATPHDGGEGLGEVILRLYKRFGKQINSADDTRFWTASSICLVWDSELKPPVDDAIAQHVEDLFQFHTLDHFPWGLEKILSPANAMTIYVVDAETEIRELRLIRKRITKHLGPRLPAMKDDPWSNLLADPGRWVNYVRKEDLGAPLEPPMPAPDRLTLAKAVWVPSARVVAMEGRVLGSDFCFGLVAMDVQKLPDVSPHGERWGGIGHAAWRLDAARPPFAPRVPGWVLNPQTRQWITAARVDMGLSPDWCRIDRIIATDIAEFLTTGPNPNPPRPLDKGELLDKPRVLNHELRLAYLWRAVRGFGNDYGAWDQFNALLWQGKLSPEHARELCEILCSDYMGRHPDFVLEETLVLQEGIPDFETRIKVWDRFFDTQESRPDLRAAMRIQQARAYEKLNQPERAGQMYDKVLTTYCNDGDYVIDALFGAEKLLVDLKRPHAVLPMYVSTWRRITKPNVIDKDVIPRTNWYRVGKMLVAKLEAAGQQRDADKIMNELRATDGSR